MSWPPNESLAFIAIDGDRVGDRLEQYLAQLDPHGAANYSTEVAGLFAALRTQLEQRGATVYFNAGDTLLASVPLAAWNESLLAGLQRGPCTVSIGVGRDSQAAMLALKLAKARGRDQVVSLLDSFHSPGTHTLRENLERP